MHITFGEFGLPSSQEQLGKDGQAQDKCSQALGALSKSNGMIEEVTQTRTQTQAQTGEAAMFVNFSLLCSLVSFFMCIRKILGKYHKECSGNLI